MSKLCRRFIVSGTVQGVFFRDNARKKAIELNISGWVKNVNDGSVELLACGESDHIQTLERWLWEGPTKAHVTAVDKKSHPWEEHADFIICDSN